MTLTICYGFILSKAADGMAMDHSVSTPLPSYPSLTVPMTPAEVNLKPEHQTTIEAEQDRQYGPELTPVDPSYIGQEVVGMTRVKPAAGCGSKKPFTEDVSQT